MPSTLPVPSKGALRTLRNLALGTSCTVAFTAGVLTEDRRRRIHSARQVHENAKKIRSSRQYHSAGSAALQVLEGLEERGEQFPEDTYWLPSNVLRHELSQEIGQAENKSSREKGQEELKAQELEEDEFEGVELKEALDKLRRRKVPGRKPILEVKSFPSKRIPKPSISPQFNWPTTLNEIVPSRSNQKGEIQIWRATMPESLGVEPDPVQEPAKELNTPPVAPEAAIMRRWVRLRQRRKVLRTQVLLVRNVLSTLDKEAPDLDGASLHFLGAFEDRQLFAGCQLEKPVVEAAIRICAMARVSQGKFDIANRIFDIVRSFGPMDESHFDSFEPGLMIDELLKRPAGQTEGFLDPDRLRKASEIYLTKFKEKPTAMSEDNRQRGDKLCRETCLSEMYDLTIDLYTRVAGCSAGKPALAVHHLIKATYETARYKKLFRYFKLFYSPTSPDQLQFFEVGTLVLDAIFKTGKSEQAEEFLTIAAQMARRVGILASTTWALKVFYKNWKWHQDVSAMLAQFERLLTLKDGFGHPKALYSAAIQYCSEANEYSAAKSIFARLEADFGLGPEDLRSYGHFALARAHQGDWEGVREDFRYMYHLDPFAFAEMSRSFAPVLKVFMKSHSITEIEAFVQEFLNDFKIEWTPLLISHMAWAYADQGSIDSIVLWVKYVLRTGVHLDASFFNTILDKGRHSWNLDFWALYLLYSNVLVDEEGKRLINKDTITILRRIAATGSPNPAELARRLKAVRSFHQPGEETASERIYNSMMITLANSRPEVTLNMYKRAMNDRFALNTKHLSLAVRASLLVDTDPTETGKLLSEGQKKAWNIGPAVIQVYIHQLDGLLDSHDVIVEDILNAARSTRSMLERSKITIPPDFIIHTMSMLERKGHPREALAFWQSMQPPSTPNPFTQNPITLSSSLDLPTLTVILESYIRLGDSAGIARVMRILTRSEHLIPDQKFKLVLLNARRVLADRVVVNPWLTDLLEAVLKALKDLKAVNATVKAQRAKVLGKLKRVLRMVVRGRGVDEVDLEEEEQGEEEEEEETEGEGKGEVAIWEKIGEKELRINSLASDGENDGMGKVVDLDEDGFVDEDGLGIWEKDGGDDMLVRRGLGLNRKRPKVAIPVLVRK